MNRRRRSRWSNASRSAARLVLSPACPPLPAGEGRGARRPGAAEAADRRSIGRAGLWPATGHPRRRRRLPGGLAGGARSTGGRRPGGSLPGVIAKARSCPTWLDRHWSRRSRADRRPGGATTGRNLRQPPAEILRAWGDRRSGRVRAAQFCRRMGSAVTVVDPLPACLREIPQRWARRRRRLHRGHIELSLGAGIGAP
jgi:hypothetical protein